MSDYAEEYIKANIVNLGYHHSEFAIEFPERDSSEYRVYFNHSLDLYSKQEIDDVFAGMTWWYGNDCVGITVREEMFDEELIDNFLNNLYRTRDRQVWVGGKLYEIDELENIDWVKGEYPFYFWARAFPVSSDEPDLDVVFKFTREELESMDYRLIDWNKHLDDAKEAVYNKRPKKKGFLKNLKRKSKKRRGKR